MAAGLILEFQGIDSKQYEAVNSKLGIDAKTGKGDWPEGLRSHAGGQGDDGNWVVLEVWDSKDAQAAFMHGRLGAALAELGVSEPSRIVWVDLVAYHTP